MAVGVLKRVLAGAAVIAALLVLPGSAFAVVQSNSVVPCNTGCNPNKATFTANGSSSFTASTTFDSGAGAPISLVADFAPGLLANLNQNSACIAAIHYDATCLVGTGTVIGPNTAFNMYLVPASAPASSGHPAAIDFTNTVGTPVEEAHAELGFKQNSSGDLVSELNLPLTPTLFNSASGLMVNVNGMIGAKPFTRMPSACTLSAPSTVTVTYPSNNVETTDASPDVDVSSTCGALPYAPNLTATAQKDATDQGVQVTTEVTQLGTEAATKTSTLTTPSSTLSPNITAAAALIGTNTPVGTATSSSPLLPLALHGTVYLKGNLIGPYLSVEFANPLNPALPLLKLTGVISLANNSVTFAKNPSVPGSLNVPDAPVSDLKVTLSGGPNALFTSSCATPTGVLSGSFNAQNGKTQARQAPLTVHGCPSAVTPGKPTATGSFSGLKTGHPKLKITAKHGTNAPNISSLSVSLPGGLSFRCKVKKNRCKGLKVSGGKIKSLTVRGKKLVIKLKSAVASVSITAGGKLLKESKGLQKKVKKKKAKQLSVTVKITDAKGKTTPISLKLAAK